MFNFGCEGIVRGTFAMLREQWPSCTVVYATPRPEEDGRYLRDLPDLEIVQGIERWTPGRIARAIGQKLGIARQKPATWKRKFRSGFDAVLSIGGDIYTIRDDAAEESYSHSLAGFGESVLAAGGRYVLWGCSVGPFTSHPGIETYFARHLSGISMINAREEETYRYLQNLGCAGNLRKIADPAFIMTRDASCPDIPRNDGDILIGLNLSPLSLSYLYPGEEMGAQMMRLAECVDGLLSANRAYRIIAIPHVCPMNGGRDDDHAFLDALIEQVSEKDRIELLEPGLGARVTKGMIAQCDVLVSARMHCAIAGVSAGVPTVFLQYSSKAKGMADYCYGPAHEMCLPIREVTPEALVRVVGGALADKEKLSAGLRDSLAVWQKDSRQGARYLAELLNA